MPSRADTLLNGVLRDLGLERSSPATIYDNITAIVQRLQAINARDRVPVGTTGTITERLCEYGLRAAVPRIYRRLAREWKWIGDFYVLGAPFNTIITVKSFKAKERLLSSGTGNVLSPSIGYGLFDEPREWSRSRLESYLFRAFFIIYMPENTLERLDRDVRRVRNLNGNLFLRSVQRFTHDLRAAVANGLLDPRRL